MYNKQHLIAVLWYIGIWFIWWSISHGFFSGTRSIIMAVLWIILFILSEYLKEGEKNYAHLILWWLVYSIAVGMVNGGFQHFLDSPMRSLWIIPVGWIVSTLIFPYKEWLQHYDFKKSLLTGWLISLVLFVVLYAGIKILPSNLFGVWDDHSEKNVIQQTIEEKTNILSDHH